MNETTETQAVISPESSEIKLSCKTLFNKQGELSSLRCAIFSIKVLLWTWLIMLVPALVLAALAAVLAPY